MSYTTDFYVEAEAFTENYGDAERLLLELEKITTPLNREEAQKTLYKLATALSLLEKNVEQAEETLKSCREDATLIAKLWDENPLMAIGYAVLKAWAEMGEPIRYEIASLSTDAKSLARDAMSRWSSGNFQRSEQEIKEKIFELSEELRKTLKGGRTMMEKVWHRQFGEEKIPIVEIMRLTTLYTRDWPKLNSRWACCACYLAAMELSVNKACEELRNQALGNDNDSFKKKLGAVVGEMKKKNIQITSIEKSIVTNLYEYRCKVLHHGYIPDNKEFSYILDVVPRFIASLKKCIAT